MKPLDSSSCSPAQYRVVLLDAPLFHDKRIGFRYFIRRVDELDARKQLTNAMNSGTLFSAICIQDGESVRTAKYAWHTGEWQAEGHSTASDSTDTVRTSQETPIPLS
jgi:hypothetical protein